MSKNMYKKVWLILFLLGELSRNEANYCGQKIFSGNNGTIQTNPGSSDENTSCIWTIHPPQNAITTIRIVQFDLGVCLSKYPCCLSVLNADFNKSYIKVCNETTKKPVTLSIRENKTFIVLEAFQHIEIKIAYFTRGRSECPHSKFQCSDKTGCYNSTDNCSGNFVCRDHSDKVDCGKCEINFTLCDLNSDKCFDPISQRCDNVLHCPKGEDEFGCSDICSNAIKCPKDKKCITQNQICDGKTDCSDGFDEKGCPSESSSKTYFTVIFIISSLCSTCFLCILVHLISTRRGTRRFHNNPPDFPLAPFEGPGDYENDSSSSEIFTESEFRQGGAIYESYLDNIKKVKSVKTISSNRKKSYMDLDGDNELIVLASLNVPVDMCVGLTVSAENANLSAIVARERLESISKLNVTVSRQTISESSKSTELQCIHEKSQNFSNRSSEKNSRLTFVVSSSSEWTDIDETTASSSGIVFVKSANSI